MALKLFAEKGYGETGVAEICSSSDVSKGAFYHHFPTKQALFIDLLGDWLGGVDRELERSAKSSPTVPGALLSMASETKEIFNAADGKLQIFLEFWEQARHDPDIWKAFIAPYRKYREYLSSIVQKGIDEGSFGGFDAQVGGQALVALAVGIVVQGVLDPEGAQWNQVIQDAVRLLMNGMTRR
jgi:AcrR family transcriptional regulator